MNTGIMDVCVKLCKICLIWHIVIIQFNLMQVVDTRFNYTLVGEFQPTTPAARDDFKPLDGCDLEPEIADIGDHLANILTEGFELVKIRIKISDNSVPLNVSNPVPMFHPWSWVITTGPSGRAMLLLQDNSEEMSLRTLSYGVTRLNISLTQRPEHCLSRGTVLQSENSVRKAILTGFVNGSVAIHEGAEVCNRHIDVTETGAGKLVYKCCRLSLSHTLECYTLQESAWVSILIVSIVVLQVAVVLFSPNLIPESLVKIQSQFVEYRFNTEPGNTLILRVKKVADQMPDTVGRFIPAKVRPSKSIAAFQSSIQALKFNAPVKMEVKSVALSLRPSKLLQEGQSPVSVLSFLWNFLLRCKLRSDIHSIQTCCDANVLRMFNVKRTIPWYVFLRAFMYVFVFGLLCAPWLLRVWFYFNYELEVVEQQQNAFRTRNLTLPYTGSLVTHLSPIHPLFLVINGFLVLETLLWFLFPDVFKRRLKCSIRKCLHYTQRTVVLDVCGVCAKQAIWPLEKFGIVGCLILPLWALVIPLLTIVLVIETFPIVNLSLRLFFNLIFYLIGTVSPSLSENMLRSYCGKSNNIFSDRLRSIIVDNEEETNIIMYNTIYALALASTLVTIWCLILLVTECIAFYVACAVYTLIGIILNPSDTMKFISLVLLISVYGYECFSSAYFEYSAFCKTIHLEVRDKIGDAEIERVSSKSALEQENTAFRVRSTKKGTEERMKLVPGPGGFLNWCAPRVCLFLDRYDIPFIPRQMLFEMANIDHTSCPRKPHVIYLLAFLDFMKVIAFLFFVFVVIFAFGQAQDASSGAQALAALGSGFLPLVFRKFLFSAHEKLTVDKNLKWKEALTNAIEAYQQCWAFEDIQADIAYGVGNSRRPPPAYDVNQTVDEIESSLDHALENLEELAVLSQSEPLLSHSVQGLGDDVDLVVVAKTKNGNEYYEYFVPAYKEEDMEIQVHDGEETIV